MDCLLVGFFDKILRILGQCSVVLLAGYEDMGLFLVVGLEHLPCPLVVSSM